MQYFFFAKPCINRELEFFRDIARTSYLSKQDKSQSQFPNKINVNESNNKKLGDWKKKKHELFPWLYKSICDIIKEMRLNICPKFFCVFILGPLKSNNFILMQIFFCQTMHQPRVGVFSRHCENLLSKQTRQITKPILK